MIPQILIISLGMIGLGINISKHGESETGKHNVWTSITSLSMYWAILYYGGFFDVFFK